MQPAAFTLRIHTNTLPEYAMSSFAIPAAAPPTTLATTGNASAPAGNESHFGDTLRNTQSSPQTKPQGHSANNTPAAGNTSSKPDAGKDKGKQDDERDDKSAKAKPDDQTTTAANPQPIAAPIAPPAPAAQRQPLAADGKTLPAATASATPTVNSVAATVATAAATTITAATMQPATTPTLVPATVKAAAPDPMTKPATPTEHADTTDTSDTEPTDAQGDAASATDIASILKMPARAAAQADANHDASADHHGPTDFANQLTQLVAAHVAQPGNAPPAPAPLQLAMQATPDQPQQFAQETVQHVAWLAGKGIDKAEIQLNPRKLGPISIEISNHHDRVDVSFAVQHPQTVHALQQTLPQLHDMLAQQGLNLGQASVGQQAPNQQHPAFAQHFGGAASNDVGNTENEPSRNWQSSRIAMPGRVDDFA